MKPEERLKELFEKFRQMEEEAEEQFRLWREQRCREIYRQLASAKTNQAFEAWVSHRQFASAKTNQAFEAWVSAPPHERGLLRYPIGETGETGETNHQCSGQYRNAAVQLAWEAWDAAASNGSPDFESALDAIETLIPPHSMGCCVCNKNRWLMDDANHPVITMESCTCEEKLKSIRRLLDRYRRSEKGFHPRYPDSIGTGELKQES